MTRFIPARQWTRKGPRNVSAKIRQRKSKKVSIAKKGALLPESDRPLRSKSATQGQAAEGCSQSPDIAR